MPPADRLPAARAAGGVPLEKGVDPLRIVRRIDDWLSGSFAWIAGVALVAMMLVTVADMILRQVWVPLQGTAEMVGWLSALTTAFALSYSQAKKAHTVIEVLTDRFPPRLRAAVTVLVGVLSLFTFVLATVQVFKYGANQARVGTLSETLTIPYYWIIWMAGVALVAFCLRLAIDLVDDVAALAAAEKPPVARDDVTAPPMDTPAGGGGVV